MSRKRGFTLLEIVIVLAIVALLAAVAIPYIAGSKRRGEFQEVARNLIGNVGVARSLAAKGQGSGTWAATDRTVSAGIRILSPTQYEVFIDRNTTTGGDEVPVTIVDFVQSHPGTALRITAPGVNSEIRFRSNGVLIPSNPVDVIIRDVGTNETHTIHVATGGSAKLI